MSTAAPDLPRLDAPGWELSCRDKAEKQALLDQARNCGVPIYAGVREDRDLHLEWYETTGGEKGIWSNPQKEGWPRQITATDFLAMCHAYASVRR